ncbi:MAG TPA: adenosylcobinamide-phosphate synthase CbiB [Stellaceae bacterium]|jgi:adenosylcobinamide-phosphate synthase
MLLPALSSVGGASPLLLLAVALLVDACAGEMPVLFRVVPHPVVLIGSAVGTLERRLNRDKRSERDRFARGVITVAALIAASVLVGLALAAFCRQFDYGWVAELALVAVLLAQRSLFDHVAAVERALGTDGLAAGREAVSHIVGRDPNSLDAHGVARAGIESLAENFSDGVVAPAFWYALFGLPGILAYKTANTLDSMIGHLSPRYRAFGWAAARFDDLVNFVPARLSGLLVATAAAIVPRAAPGKALATMWRDAGKHRSPNAGWPEAAMAGALGLALAGPRRYSGHVAEDPWIGDGRARATPQDIRRALLVYATACGLLIALLALIYVAAADLGGPAIPPGPRITATV